MPSLLDKVCSLKVFFDFIQLFASDSTGFAKQRKFIKVSHLAIDSTESL